MVLKVMKMV